MALFLLGPKVLKGNVYFCFLLLQIFFRYCSFTSGQSKQSVNCYCFSSKMQFKMNLSLYIEFRVDTRPSELSCRAIKKPGLLNFLLCRPNFRRVFPQTRPPSFPSFSSILFYKFPTPPSNLF